ncbi:MAG: ABC transporter ATP-binding protein [Candidatus Marinimicrobia bacterium]|nr:ABC transporter ATP-binding protein [Candidatus Neomarinimicrobiota bacterium]
MITIENLNFNYPKQSNLFNDLSLNIQAGSIHGLLGKNGSGKTTLLKIIAGLRFPNKGQCKAFGYETRYRSPEFMKELYFVPEEFYTPPVTMKQFVSIYSKFYPRFSTQQLFEYLKEFELPEDGKLSSFSYGMKKKFLISFGVATNCKILILDEPSNGLDIPSKSKLRRILASAISDDRSFVISTHQVRDIDQLIDPILIIEDGKVLFNHSLEDISKRLSVKAMDELPAEGVLHYEKTLGGYLVIQEKEDEESLAIDIETLFNAVINNKEKIREIFSDLDKN